MKGRRQTTRCNESYVTERRHLNGSTIQADRVRMKMGVNETRDNGAAGGIDGVIITTWCHISDLNNFAVGDSYSAFE
jgi:hypothetical protein